MRRLSALVAVGVAAVALVACGDDDSAGTRWPDVAIEDTAGTALTSAAILTEGRPAIVTVWGVTCAPCRVEMPRLQALADRDTGIDVAAVNLGDDPDDIAAFARDLGLSLPIYIDTEGRLAEALGVASLPATVFVGADGAIVERHLGELSAGDLDAATAQLLATTA